MNADEMNIWGPAWQIEHSVELHSSGLIGMANHSDMQKIRIIGFFLKIAYIGTLKRKKLINIVLDDIFIYIQIKS